MSGEQGDGGVIADGRTPSRFLSSFFNTQCSIYGDTTAAAIPTNNLSQNENMNVSQDFFGTQDFITPQDQEFSVQHAHGGDVNKENFRPMRSPCNLSPAARKKPKKTLYPMTGSQKSDDADQSQEQKGDASAAACTEADAGPSAPPFVYHGRGSILHYVQGTPSSRSPNRKRSIMPPPPIRSPPMIRNPFLEPDDPEDGDEKKKKKRPGQAPTSRYRADFKEMGLLGSGSFSKVYRVKNRLDGAEYAVKRSAKELYTATEKANAIQEVQALAAVGSHPNIVRYFGAWMEPSGDGEHLYMQLEVCGKSLASTLESGHVYSESDLLDIMKQMAAALRHLHQHGMVHLDVKPDNIYMSLDSGSYKLGDFGLVTKSNGQGRVMEGDGRYLPQEMLNGDHRSLEKADMFSLGATLLELARGAALPMEGSLYQAIRHGKAPLPNRLNPNSPLVKNIKALLSEAPSDRPTADAICRGASVSRKGNGGLILQPSTLSRSSK